MYQYPDRGDRMTMQLIGSVSRGNYWAESERWVLDRALEAAAALPQPRRMLDAGCGMGRLFADFAPLVESLTAVEPDRERYAGACVAAKLCKGCAPKVLHCDVAGAPAEERYELVLSSHVLQHIPEGVRREMAAILAERTVPGGLLIVLTTFHPGEEDVLNLERMRFGRRRCQVVDEAAFAAAFSEKGVLPVRMFAARSVKALFEETGFACEAMWCFHYNDSDQSAEADREKNRAGDTAAARDVLYLFRRKGL